MKRMPDPRLPVIRLLLFVGSLAWACGASAQTPRIELGLQLSGIRNGVLREYPLGGGGRITAHVFRFLDAEAEVNRFPIGGVIEFYSRHHVAGRLDLGYTAVWYGNDTIIPPISGTGGNVVPNTRHQLQWSLGLSIWF